MNEKKTIQDIIESLAENQGMNKKEAELFVKGMFNLIEEALTTEKYVKVKGLGTFKLTEVDSRESVNVNTGERIEIQGHTKISFTPDSTLKELINKPFSHFETVILDEEANGEEKEAEYIEEDNTILEAPVDFKSVEKITEEPAIEETTTETPEEKVEDIAPSEETSIVSEEMQEEPVIENIPEETLEETDKIADMPAEESSIVLEEEQQKKECSEDICEEENIGKEEKETFQTASIPEKKKGNVALWIALLLIVLLVIVGLYWIFCSPSEAEPQPEPANNTTITKEVPVVMEETVPSVTPDEKTLPAVIEPSEKVATIADTTEYKIIGEKATHTVESGETLTKIALKFYGSKNYWPYIAIHNKATLKNTNSLSVGIQLAIPELKPTNE